MSRIIVSTNSNATSGDVGKLMIFTNSVTYTFTLNGGYPGKRFEFFNSSGSTAVIKFADQVKINTQTAGGSGLSITLAPDEHILVMGIDTDEYVAWLSNSVSVAP